MLSLDNLLVPYKNFCGDWRAFNETLYEHFSDDFIEDSPTYMNKEVGFKEIQKVDGKEETFWHITSDESKIYRNGQIIKQRTPDIKRSERIRWIKEIIDNSHDASVKVWVERINGQVRHHLWYNDEFLVVLGEYPKYPFIRLITAFYVNPSNRLRYQKKYDEYMQYQKKKA